MTIFDNLSNEFLTALQSDSRTKQKLVNNWSLSQSRALSLSRSDSLDGWMACAHMHAAHTDSEERNRGDVCAYAIERVVEFGFVRRLVSLVPIKIEQMMWIICRGAHDRHSSHAGTTHTHTNTARCRAHTDAANGKMWELPRTAEQTTECYMFCSVLLWPINSRRFSEL